MFALAAIALALLRPQVAVLDTSPFMVRGTGFHPGERVTLAITTRARVTRTVIAGPRGGFTLRMTSINLGACAGYAVRATGSMGSRTSMRIIPECPDLQP
jgi:hypothetical protein